MKTNWSDWQGVKHDVERFINQVYSDGFRIGAVLPEEQMEARHRAWMHLSEIDHLMGMMYRRGLKEEVRAGFNLPSESEPE